MESGNILLSRPFPPALLRPLSARGRKPSQVQCTHSPGDGPGAKQSRAPQKKTPHIRGVLSFVESGNVLLSRPVSRQVPSALKGLTSVFGMGTGGSLSPLSPEFCQGLVQSVVLLASAVSISNHSLRLGNPPHIRASFFYCAYPENRTSRLSSSCKVQFPIFPLVSTQFFRSSPRPISIIKLHTLPHFHR